MAAPHLLGRDKLTLSSDHALLRRFISATFFVADPL